MLPVVFVSSLLVAMVMGDASSTNQHQKSSSSEQMMRNDTDVGNRTSSIDVGDAEPWETEDETIQCSIDAEQYDAINNKLSELAMQLELLRTSLDKNDEGATPTALSGTLERFRAR